MKRLVPRPLLLKCMQVRGVFSLLLSKALWWLVISDCSSPSRVLCYSRVDLTDSQLVPSTGAGGGDHILQLPWLEVAQELLPTSREKDRLPHGFHRVPASCPTLS